MRNGWTETTLGEITEVIGGGTPSTNVPEYWGNDFVWLTPTEIVSIDGKTVSDSIRKLSREGLANSGAQILPKGSVILTSRASVGFVAISDCELSTNQGFQSLIPKEKVLAYFLMYWIQNNRHEFESRAAGSTFKEISKTNVKSIKLDLPPLAEQKRIVDLISAVDCYIDALEQHAENARKSKTAVLHEILSAGGDGWTETALGEVLELLTDGSHFSPKTVISGYPYITVRDLKEGKIDFENCAFVDSHSFQELSKNGCAPREGDVLFSKDGTVGKVALVPEQKEFVVLSSLAILRPNLEIVSPQFLAIYLRSDDFQSRAIGNKTGLAIKRLVLKTLRTLLIMVPPLPEQVRIVDLISSMDDGISATEKLISETKRLRSGLLSDLLRGEHEIPESYDEVMGEA